MGAVHQASVTVWQVSGATPHLAFKQVRKISVQPIPQGCLWNPQCDVVCLLSHQQCSFYFRHTHNRGSFAFPSLENGKISCGCWSPDGKRLVICVGTALLIYTWTDIEANINDFVTTAWRIPGVSGHITAIVAASDSSVVCATALPLDLLCTNNNNNNHHDSLAFPGAGNSQPGADGVLRPHGAPSVKDSLLSLHLAAKGEVQDAAMLSVVQLRSGVHDPCVVTSAVVPGLLSPDLLHFQMESQCVVVGSNTQTGLQVFALLENQLAFAGHLTLGKEERPKGVCGLRASRSAGSHGVLVLAGKTEAGDAATFPSANNTAHFSLTLTFFPTCPEKARQLMNGLVKTTKTASSVPLPKPEVPREPGAKSVSDSKLLASKGGHLNRPPHEDRGDSSAVRMSIPGTDSRRSGSKLVEDITTDTSPPAVEADRRRVSASQVLETERADFTHTAPQFSNSVLAERYEMNRSEHGQESVSNAPCNKSSPGVSRREGTRGGKAGDRMTNGHSCADGEVAKFFLPDASEEGSVRAGPLDPQQQTTSPALSGGHTHRGGKEGSGGEGEGGSLSSSFNSSDSNYELLEKQIQVQRDQIDTLQRKLADLSTMVEDTACVFPIRYQSATEPEAATVHCVVGGKSVSRKFLLDNGRLQLDPVKQAFGLLTVELILDGEPLVLGANIDGYIPMKFSANSQLQITGIPMAFSPQTKPRSHRKDIS